MNKNIFKNKKVIELIVLIIIALSIILFLFFTKDNSVNKNSTGNTNIIPNIKLPNNISSTVSKYNFNLNSSNLLNTANLYTNNIDSYSLGQNAAAKLNMQKQDSSTDIYNEYADSDGNRMTSYQNTNLITINNITNAKLKNFTQDNALIKMEGIFNANFQNYYLTGIESSKGGIVLSYSYKIDGYLVLKDYSVQTLLSLYILPDGTLTKLSWEYILPQAKQNIKLKTIDYIKNNIDTLPKGIYPNPTTIGEQEDIANYENFVGSVNITDVSLSYLINNNGTELDPVYKFTAKFLGSNGTVKDGTIIISAPN